jgi:hypothetical protein
MLKKIVIVLLYVYTFVFFSPLLIDIFVGSLGTFVKIFLILILWLITFLLIRKKLELRYIKIIDKILISLIIFMFFTVIISIYREIPLIVILFSLFLPIAFYPLIYFFFYIRSKHSKFNHFLFHFLLFLIILTDLIAIGIVWDSQSGLINLPFLGDRLLQIRGSYSEAAGVDASSGIFLGEQKRGSFLIGGSTSIYPIISVGCLSNVLFFRLFFKKESNPLLFMPTFLIIWVGAWFSLSRTPLLLTTIICIYGILNLSFTKKSMSLKNQLKILSLIIIPTFTIPIIQSIIFNNMSETAILRFDSFFNSESESNYLRYQSWEKGMNLFQQSDSWLGYGSGTSTLATRKFIHSSLLRGHYESSIFSAFSENGLFGLLILLTPYIAIIILSLKTPNPGIFIVWSCLVVINLFSAPINGYNVVFPCFLVMALCFSLRFYSPRLKKPYLSSPT